MPRPSVLFLALCAASFACGPDSSTGEVGAADAAEVAADALDEEGGSVLHDCVWLTTCAGA